MTYNRLSNNYIQLFWSRDKEELFNEPENIWIEMNNDGRWKEYVIDLSNNTKWNSIIRRLRIDFLEQENYALFGIDYIRFAA